LHTRSLSLNTATTYTQWCTKQARGFGSKSGAKPGRGPVRSMQTGATRIRRVNTLCNKHPSQSAGSEAERERVCEGESVRTGSPECFITESLFLSLPISLARIDIASDRSEKEC